jgi:di/tricarboxylate transporter
MVFCILAGAIVLLAWGPPRVDIVAILIVLALMLSRVLTPHEALAGFGDPVVILIAAIFIVGEALVNTGIAHRLGEAVMKLGLAGSTRSLP